MSNKCWSGTGKEGKTKEVVKDREVKKVVCEELCTKAWNDELIGAHIRHKYALFFVHRQRQLRRTRFLPTLGQNDRGGTWQQCERHAAMRQQRSDQIRNKLMRWQSVVQGNYQIFCWYYIICMLLLLCVAVWRSFHLRWPWTTAMGLFKCAPYSIAKQSTHYNSQHHRTQLLQRLHQCEACGSNKKHLTKHLTTRQPWICKPHLQVSHA